MFKRARSLTTASALIKHSVNHSIQHGIKHSMCMPKTRTCTRTHGLACAQHARALIHMHMSIPRSVPMFVRRYAEIVEDVTKECSEFGTVAKVICL